MLIIYKAKSKVNGKSYIGQTCRDLNKRINSHIYGKGNNNYFHNSLKKYGRDNFFVETVAYCCNKEHADFLEKFYIKLFNSKFPNGYNLTDGGEGNLGWVPSEKTKEKMSIANSGINAPMFGRKGKDHPMHGKYGDKNPFFGRNHTDEQKKKWSEEKSGENHPFFNKHHSDETKKLMSEKHKGEKSSSWINISNGELVKEIKKLCIERNKIIGRTEWRIFAKERGFPQHIERRFGNWSNFLNLVRGD